jgi:hypothetical protein
MADVSDFLWYSPGASTAITGPDDTGPTVWTNFPSSGVDYTLNGDAEAVYLQFVTITVPTSDLYLYVLGKFVESSATRYVALAAYKWEANNVAGPVIDDGSNALFAKGVHAFPAGIYDGIKLYTQSADSSFSVKVQPYFGMVTGNPSPGVQ